MNVAINGDLTVKIAQWLIPVEHTVAYLSEFWLPVWFSTFISVTPGNLEVPVYPSHHQQLFELQGLNIQSFHFLEIIHAYKQ